MPAPPGMRCVIRGNGLISLISEKEGAVEFEGISGIRPAAQSLTQRELSTWGGSDLMGRLPIIPSEATPPPSPRVLPRHLAGLSPAPECAPSPPSQSAGGSRYFVCLVVWVPGRIFLEAASLERPSAET